MTLTRDATMPIKIAPHGCMINCATAPMAIPPANVEF